MTITIDAPRFTNTSTFIDGLTMGEGKNFLDTRNGLIIGKIFLLGGNDTFLGASSSETIYGGSGNDLIKAGDGNDRIVGGSGRDVLSGGVGKDAFYFSFTPVSANVDVITDFKSSDDTVKISAAFFKGIGSKGALKTDALHFGGSAADLEDRLVYSRSKGVLYFDQDGTGPLAQIKIAEFTNKAKLALSDFQIF